MTAERNNLPGSTTVPVRAYQPLVAVAGAFVVGIVAAEFLGAGTFLWCGAAAVALAVWAGLCLLRARTGWLLVPLLVLVAAIGGARYRVAVDPPADDVARLTVSRPRLVTLEGTVVRSARQWGRPSDVFLPSVPYYARTTFTLACESAEVERRWLGARGRVTVAVRGPMPADPRGVPCLGDRVQVVGILMPFREPANPGAFDTATYLRRMGVRAYCRTDHWEAVRVVKPATDRLRWLAGAMRRWALRRLDHIESKEGRAVVSAIMLGRRDLLDLDAGVEAGEDIEDAFIASGTAHFLAVSGLHVGLVAAIVLLVTRLIGLGARPTAALVAAVVLAYALMTELKPSVLRAAILIWILCLGWMTGGRPLRLNSLAAAVLIVLLLRPGDLFTTGFQLSFAVVVGLFWLTEKVEATVLGRDRQAELLSGVPGGDVFHIRHILRRTVALSIAASLVGVPLVAYKFHLVAWLAPVGSVLLSPLVFVLLAGGMLLVSFGWIAPWVAALVAAIPDGLALAIGGIVRALASVPYGHFYTAGFSWPWLVGAYGLLAAWVWRERLGLSRRRLGIVALALAAAFLWTGGHKAPRGLRATFIAVGGGNTNLLELPNGRNLLYDAGSSLSYARAAETTIAPALWSRGIERIDAVFLSHAHFDHFKDILPLVQRFGIRQVFVPPTFLRNRLSIDDAVIEALLARGVDVTFFSAGDRLSGTGDVEVRAVWPRGPASMTRQINDGSLVLSLVDRGRRLLLTGDLEADGIAAMLEAEPNLRADALLWPHHGGSPEAVNRLVEATGAKALIVSARYGPLREPAWLKERGTACYRTAEHGMITLELGAGGLAVEHFIEKRGLAEPAASEPQAEDQGCPQPLPRRADPASVSSD